MAREEKTKIKCPYCKKSIALTEALTGSIEKELSKKLKEEFQEELDESQNQLKDKEKELESLKKHQDKRIEEALEKEKANLLKDAIKRAEENSSKELKDIKEQLKEKSEKLEKAEEEELKLRKEKRELEEAKKKFNLDMERKLDEERNKIFDEAAKKVHEEHDLKDKERQKQLDDAKKQLEDMKRKMEQGSQQLQGEVLELEIEDSLKETFVLDKIEPIGKGVQGADVIQRVCSRSGKICGSILFESKRTKNWSNSWITKLKEDQREAKADIAVLVTTIMPQDAQTIEYREGIIIVDYRYIVPLTSILRNQILELYQVKNSNVGKNEKIEALYSYLTSPEFRQRIESIVEAFGNMMSDLYKEKKAMTKIWAKREMQIGKAVNGIVGMYGSMQGVIGSSLPNIKSLELINDETDLEENEETIKQDEEMIEEQSEKDLSIQEEPDIKSVPKGSKICPICEKSFKTVSKTRICCSYDCISKLERLKNSSTLSEEEEAIRSKLKEQKYL